MMAREYLPKLTIAILALSIALVFLSAQGTVAASPTNPQTLYPASYHHYYHYYYHYYYNWYYYYPSSCYGYGYCYSSNYYYPSSCGYYSYYYYSSYCSNSYSSYYSTPSSYTLTVATNPSNLGTVTGGGTYTPGSSASFSVTQTTIQVSPSTQYVFSHWSGDYTGTGSSGTVTVNGAMAITAVYQPQYYLSVQVQPQNAPTPQGQGWYNAGSTASLPSPAQTVGGDGGSRLVFQGWSVDGQEPQSGPSLNLVMNSPQNVTAVYGQQYYLNVQTDQGVASGSGWYDAGSTAQIYVSTPVSTSYGVSIVFNGWQGDIQSSNQSTGVPMNGPMNVVATWRTDSTVLYLTIAAVIVAALLIAGGVIAFLARGRGNQQSPPPQTTAYSNTSNTSPQGQSNTTHRTEHHRKKPENTQDTQNTQDSETPTS
jgi:hypothetical protein